MARSSRLPRAMREIRRGVEQQFRGTELVIFGLESGVPDAVLAAAETALGTLHPDDVKGREVLTRRLQDLGGVVHDDAAKARYIQTHGVDEVLCTRTSSGERIYRLVATTFPNHENYVYLVITSAGPLLVDVGSGALSRDDILRGLRVVEKVYGEAVSVRALKGILISHAHIDHFGDVAFFKQESGAPVMIHELDARVLTRFEERMVVSAKDMGIFLARSGVAEPLREKLERMYLSSKDFFSSVDVDVRLRHQSRILGNLQVLHTPGHCPGHLCLRVGNALLVADQVLNPITPNLSPQTLAAFNGLENYLHGLLRLRALEGVEHVLPAHANPIPNLGARIDEILEHHQTRLAEVVTACHKPMTLAEISEHVFGRQENYNILLALTETGAHVEYLHQYGRLRIANLDEVEKQRDPVIRYVADHEP